VKINDKHIEVIIRQMLQKVEVTDAGETTLIAGEQVDREELDEENKKAIEANKRPAAGQPLLPQTETPGRRPRHGRNRSECRECARAARRRQRDGHRGAEVRTAQARPGRSRWLIGCKDQEKHPRADFRRGCFFIFGKGR
jgi:hypothetical protein